MSEFNAKEFFRDDEDNLERFNSYYEEAAEECADRPNPVHEAELSALSRMLYEDSTGLYEDFYEKRGEKFEGDLSAWAYGTALAEINSSSSKEPGRYQANLEEIYQYMPEDFKRDMEEKYQDFTEETEKAVAGPEY